MSKFNTSAIDNIDQETVEQDGQQYPVISCRSGDPALKKAGGISYTGGWYVSVDGNPDMTAHGWERDSFVNADGKDVEVYYKPQIEIAVITQRKRWQVDGKPFAWNAYNDAKAAGAPRGHHQYLVLVKDAEELGPFVIGLRGHAGMSFAGSGSYSASGGLSCMNRTVIAAANALTKPKKWPFRAFWLTMAAATDKGGQPKFVEVGQGNSTSKIVLPVPVGLPDKSADVNLDDFYVGDDTLALTNQIYIDAQPWRDAWNSFDASTEQRTNGKVEPEAEKLDEAELAEAGL